MRIIPAIDIINGQCVRLTQGDFGSKKIYYEDPVQAATAFERAGLRYLHLVDLDGAKERRVINWDTLERIAEETALQIDVSGCFGSVDGLSSRSPTTSAKISRMLLVCCASGGFCTL